jgi:hypothetical protein
MFKNILAALTYVAFGFGNLPGVTDGGLFVIGFFDQDPHVHPEINKTGIYLISFEL